MLKQLVAQSKNHRQTFIDLWRQFIPLSMSDVTMACGEPLITTTLARLPLPLINLGALGIAKTLAIFFESPIIMMLHASNALAPSQASRQALWRFMLYLAGMLSLLLGLLTLPPIFTFVGNHILGVPPALTNTVRQVLILMFLWPFAIAWRRYFQGLLIHAGYSKPIARASFVRLITVGLMLLIGVKLGLPGAIVGGLALIIGVIMEAIIVTWAAQTLGVTKPPDLITKENLPFNLPTVFSFYWPLACSMVLAWGGRTVLIGIIARSLDRDVALAIWPAAWGLVTVIANATRMVQQIIIRNRGQVPDQILIFFSVTVGIICSCILLLASTTAWGEYFVESFVGGDRILVNGIRPVLLLCTLIPLAVALQNAMQGFLVSAGRTVVINQATFSGIFVLLIVAWLAVQQGMNGAIAAALAMVLSLLTEITYLGWQIKRIPG